MRQQLIGAVAALSLAGFTPVVWAADDDDEAEFAHEESDLGFVGELNFEYGGENVDVVTFTDGSTQDVKAGQGVSVGVGMHYRPANWDVDFSGTVGYKFVTTKASNANITLTRAVVQFLGTYDPKDSWWVAAGPVWHIGTKYNTDGLRIDHDYGNSLGFTLQAGWKWFGVTYTNMKYEQQPSPGTTGAGTKVDASVVGLTIRWRS